MSPLIITKAALTAGLDDGERATLRGLLGRIAATQGLASGVHPGFADPMAHPRAGIDKDG